MKSRISQQARLLMIILLILPKQPLTTSGMEQSKDSRKNPGPELITIIAQELEEEIKRVQEETVKAILEEKEPIIAEQAEKISGYEKQTEDDKKAIDKAKKKIQIYKTATIVSGIISFILGILAGLNMP